MIVKYTIEIFKIMPLRILRFISLSARMRDLEGTVWTIWSLIKVKLHERKWILLKMKIIEGSHSLGNILCSLTFTSCDYRTIIYNSFTQCVFPMYIINHLKFYVCFSRIKSVNLLVIVARCISLLGCKKPINSVAGKRKFIFSWF